MAGPEQSGGGEAVPPQQRGNVIREMFDVMRESWESEESEREESVPPQERGVLREMLDVMGVHWRGEAEGRRGREEFTQQGVEQNGRGEEAAVRETWEWSERMFLGEEEQRPKRDSEEMQCEGCDGEVAVTRRRLVEPSRDVGCEITLPSSAASDEYVRRMSMGSSGESASDGGDVRGRFEECVFAMRQLFEAEDVLPLRQLSIDCERATPDVCAKEVFSDLSQTECMDVGAMGQTLPMGVQCVRLVTARDRPSGDPECDDEMMGARDHHDANNALPVSTEKLILPRTEPGEISLATLDAGEPKSDVDRSIDGRRGLHRLHARQEGGTGPADQTAAAKAARMIPEGNQDKLVTKDQDGCVDTTSEVKTATPTDYVESALPYIGNDGVFRYECYKFTLRKAFLLFYAAHRAGERVVRAVALSMKSEETVQEWMAKLEGLLARKGVAGNILQIYVADGMEIWAAAEAGRERQKVLDQTRASEEGVEGTGRVSGDQMAGTALAVGTRVPETVKSVARAVVSSKPPGILMQTVAYVNGSPEIVFNDSGADVSCVSTAMAKRLRLEIRQSELTVHNPNGTPFSSQGTADLSLRFGDRDFNGRFHVLDELDVGILVGDDFLREHKCVMSYGAGFIEYGGIPVRTVQSPRPQAARNAYRATEGAAVTLQTGTLPTPGQPQDVMGSIALPKDFVYSTHAWMFEPLMLTESTFGVVMAPAVVKLEDKMSVRIRLVGAAGLVKPSFIPAGTVLGVVRTIRGARAEAMLQQEIKAVRMMRTEPAGPGRPQREREDIFVPPEVSGFQNLTTTTPEDEEGARQGPQSEGDNWEASKGAEFKAELEKVMKSLPEELTAEERQALEDTLCHFRRTLCPTQLGSTHIMTVDIDPGGAKTVCHRDRRWSPQETQAIKEQVAGLLAAGLIEPSDSPWSNRLVCAPKKGLDGTKTEIRVCVDFRDVNALCVKDAYPSPNIEATLDQLNKAKWYSSVDLAKGYHQVPLTERAKQICSFRCPSGFFRYTRMPFGIMNAPAAFQRMMDVVLRDIAWKCCMVYIDDVIIYSASWADHVDHVFQVLQRIKDAGLTVGLKKCSFGRREVAFLGYIVSDKGIRPDPAKVAAIKAFKIPTSLSELRSFLGLAGQFRKFVRHYGDMVRPLQLLTRKEAHGLWTTGHVWTEERELSFEAAKLAITEEVTLAHPKFDRPLLMVCDASDQGMGAMLAQLDENGDERPIAFTSATFYGPALRYTTTEKEGLAVVWAAAQFRPYIHGVPTVVVTDHAALTWILSRGDPPARIAHWVMDLSQYDMTFVHRKGAHNNVADALSRLQARMEAASMTDGDSSIEAAPTVRGLRSSRRKASPVETPSTERNMPQHTSSNKVPEDSLQHEPAGAEADAREQMSTSPAIEPLEAVGCEGRSDRHHQRMDGISKKSESTATAMWEEVAADGGIVTADMSTEEFISEQIMDTETRAMRSFVQNGEVPTDPTLAAWVLARSDEFLMQGGLLVKAEQMKIMSEKTVKLLLVVPRTLRSRVISACHDSAAFGGHMDANRTCARVRRHFWWGRLYTDVHDYVHGCLTCRSAAKRTAGPAPIAQHHLPKRPFEFMAVDLLAMPESSTGNKYAMVVMDHFTRYATVVAIPDKSAATVAKAIVDRVILVHGPPTTLLSDQGREFDNELLLNISKKFSIKKVFTTPYRPQSDGLVERFNRTLIRLLRCFVDGTQANWDEVLPYVLYAYNTAVSAATGETPFTIVFGREPSPPIFSDVLDAAGNIKAMSDPSMWRQEVQRALSEEFMEQLASSNAANKAKRNEAANAKRKPKACFRPGLVVLVANHQKPQVGAGPKLARQQRGLFVVVRMVSPVTAEIRKVADGKKRLQKVHIDNLEPIRQAGRTHLVLDSPFPITVSPAEESADAEDGEGHQEVLEVEKVVGLRVENGQLQFKVRWLGYDNDEDMWLAENEMDCPRLVEDFVALEGDRLQRVC